MKQISEAEQIDAMFRPLSMLFAAVVDMAEEYGFDDIPGDLHDPLYTVLLARQRLKLLSKEEKKLLKKLKAA